VAVVSKGTWERQGEAYMRFLREEEQRVVAMNLPAFSDMQEKRKLWPLREGYHNESKTYYGRVGVHFGNHTPVFEAGARILDLGCSKGLTTIELANIHRGCEVLGIEVRGYLKGFMDYISERVGDNGLYLWRHVPPGLRHRVSGIERRMALPAGFIIGDGFKSSFPDKSFDAVYCMGNIYYVMNQLDDQTRNERFRQVFRLVKDGGYLLVSGGSLSDFNREYDVAAVVVRKDGEKVALEHASVHDSLFTGWDAFFRDRRLRSAIPCLS
jgi:SAM-dependent methyltransferase